MSTQRRPEKRLFEWECVNCLDHFVRPDPALFCSDLCREEAKYVRYVRRCSADGRTKDPDVRDAIHTRRAFVLSGGYNWRARRLPASLRVQVRKRDGGRCQLCGGIGTEIDHVEGNDNSPSNLRLLCHECHAEKTLGDLVPLTPDRDGYEEAMAKIQELDERCSSKHPLRQCDDQIGWPDVQRQLLRDRRTLVNRT